MRELQRDQSEEILESKVVIPSSDSSPSTTSEQQQASTPQRNASKQTVPDSGSTASSQSNDVKSC